jgi:ligand-binding sensor domain-containing protein
VNAACAVGSSAGIVPLRRHDPRVAVRDSLVDAQGRVWLATLGGLQELIDGRVELRLPGAFETLIETPVGELWLAPAVSAVQAPEPWLTRYVMHSAASDRIPMPIGASVYDMLAAKDRIWLASGVGLLEFDPVTGTFATHVATQEDAGRVIYSVLDDDAGQLWLGSNRGLLRFDPAAPAAQRFQLFDARDGLAFGEFNRRSRARDGAGRLLFESSRA